MIAWLASAAWAAPDPSPDAPPAAEAPPPTEEPPPRTIELEAPTEVGESALDGLDEDAKAEGKNAPLPLRLPVPVLRSRFSVRPLLGPSFLAADQAFWAMRIGAAVSHRAWFLSDRTVQFAALSELSAQFPFGAADGRRLELSSTVGPWIGPVGLQIGATARTDRVRWRNANAELPGTLAVGPRGDVALQVGRLRASLGLEVAWLLLGDRPAADPETAILPVLGDETAWRASLGWQGDRWFVGVRGTWRETAIGAEVDTNLSLGLRLF